MTLYINQKILLGLFSTIIIIIVLGIASFWYMQEVIQASRQGNQSQLLILCSERVRSLFTDLETMERHSKAGVNSRVGKEAFEKLVLAGENQLKILDTLSIASSLVQKKQIAQLKELVKDKIGDISKTFTVDTLDVKINSSQTQEYDRSLHEVNDLVNRIQAEEKDLKVERAIQVTHQFARFAFSFFGLLLSGMIILSVLIYSLNSNMKARLKAEENLKQASSSVHDLYNKAPCGYFSIDKAGMFTRMNQTLLDWVGYPIEKVVHNFHIREIFSSDLSVLYNDNSTEFREKGFLADIESSAIRQDQTVFPVIINAIALFDQSGVYIGSRCSLFDNTERKIAEDNAKALTKELEAFTYSVSHDLRSPLRSIKGYTQILKEDYSDQMSSDAVNVLDSVLRNANRMSNLIEDLLDFSHTNRKSIVKAATNMTEFVTQIMNEFLENEKERQIKIMMEDLGLALVDKSMLRQVWINLLSNALKYTRIREVAIINIWCIQKNEETVYAIKDNGAGFNMKYYNKLFGVFSRLHKQEEFEGTGVGLALVQRIVERHNGRVWAEAKENEGATFFFSIAKM